MPTPTVASGIFPAPVLVFRAFTLTYPFRTEGKTVATQLRDGPSTAPEDTVRPPPARRRFARGAVGLGHLKAHSSPIVNRQAEDGETVDAPGVRRLSVTFQGA